MSTAEAAAWIADPQEPALDNVSSEALDAVADESGSSAEALDELQAALAQVADEPDEYLPGQYPLPGDDLGWSPGEKQMYEPRLMPTIRQEVRREAGKPQQAGLRSMDEVDYDLDLVTGPAALAVTPEARHLASLRLFDDLISTRVLLANFTEAIDGMRSR